MTPQDRKTLGQLTGLADGVVRAAKARRDLHIDVPSRTLSNVRYCPRKRIIEMGTHAQLLRRRGPYYRLYTRQFRRQLEQVYDPFAELSPAPA